MSPFLVLITLIILVAFSEQVESNKPGYDEETILGSIIAPRDRQNTDDDTKFNDYYYGYRNDEQQLPIEPQLPVTDDQYIIGVGIADITGPAADINLMGYAKPSQDSGGIHLRQFSRTIIVGDSQGTRVMYISIDNGMISQLLRMQVLKQLNSKYEGLYNQNNVMMSASHSHSCPGGFFQFVLYNIPSQGFIAQTLEALVGGILRSVERAHTNMKLGHMSYIEGKLTGASINRSPTAYENNPPLERSQYDQNTDNEMILVRMTDLNGLPIAMMNWFPVHGTSMNNTNHLISGDNKGYASILFEEQYNNGALPGKGKFVAIFAQANEGDVSPNTRGPRCLDTGLPCDSAHSTCGMPPRNEKCVASGPGKDMFESTKIIAYKQYNKAKELFDDVRSQIRIRGKIRFIHQHIDMSSQILAMDTMGNVTQRTCKPALGYSFAAGTTDGPGAFDFQQGDTNSSPYWNIARDFLRKPSEQQVECHHPKPVLFSTGEMNFPYAWHPTIVPTQIIMIGQLAIVGLPGEFTTMSGRRIRKGVSCVFNNDNFDSCLNKELVNGTIMSATVPVIESNVSNNETDNRYRPSQQDKTQQPSVFVGARGNNLPLSSTATFQQTFTDTNNNNMRIDTQRQNIKLPLIKQTINKRDAQQVKVTKLLLPPLQLSSVHQSTAATSTVPNLPVKVVLSGLSNIYSSYITTFEEYQVQRYEGASTIYGPYTLQAYLNQFVKLAKFMKLGQPIDNPGPEPENLLAQQIVLKPGVIFDSSPYKKHFGDVLDDVDTSKIYKCQDVVRASFVAGHPRNDLRQEGTFMLVERFNNETKRFDIIASDSSWETKFIWQRTNSFLGESKAILEWDIPVACKTGLYRLKHFGASKSLVQQIKQYTGQSSIFQVLSDQHQSHYDELKQMLADYNYNLNRTVLITNNGNNNNNQVSPETAASSIEPHYIRVSSSAGPSSSSTRVPNRDENKKSLTPYSPMAILSSIFNWKY